MVWRFAVCVGTKENKQQKEEERTMSMMNKGVNLGIITAMNCERDSFFEAVKMHNDLLNQPTSISSTFHPYAGNTIYDTKLYFETEKRGKNSLISSKIAD